MRNGHKSPFVLQQASWLRETPIILERLQLDENEKDALEHIVSQMESERGLDRAAAIAHMRFDFIENVCDETVVRPRESKEHCKK